MTASLKRLPSAVVGARLAILHSVLLCFALAGQESGEDRAAARAPPKQVAAQVDGQPIYAAEVEREIAIAYGNQKISADARPYVLAKTLEQVISRRLVLRWLAETKQGANQAEVDIARAQLEKRLTQRGTTLDEFLRQQQLDEAGLRRSLTWQVGWQRFLDKQLTDKNLEKYFEKHRRDFDGTEIRIAHILFRIESSDDAQAWDAARTRAQQVLAQIRAGNTSFTAAAREYSDSPSKDQEGDIGFIARLEPMPESFSRAAFGLELNQVSEPVTATLGVHLIKCLEIKPGQKRWQDTRAELEQAVTSYLFRWTADQMRPRSRVEYVPAFPHFKVGTETLEVSCK